MFNFYSEKLDELALKDSLRKIPDISQNGKYVELAGKKMLNLSSNDYLGVSFNKDIRENFLSSYKGKIQNPSARLLSGTNKIYAELENLIAQTLKKDGALLFNSGYHANVGIYSSLLSKEDVVFVDRLNHASIIDGIRLSGAKIIPFEHKNYEDLEDKAKKYRANYRNSIISTESLFSMDGDFADIKRLGEIKERFNSILVVDEAHSFGTYGKGAGYSAETGALDKVDLIMGTFGKAIGSYGAYAAGNKVLINYLMNFARSFIFSTSLPEISVAFSKYVLENHIINGKIQDRLFKITEYTLKKFEPVSKLSSSYIIPVITGTNKSAVDLSASLQEEGFYVLPIRYPTVKKNEARIRISLNPYITKEEIDRLFECVSTR